MIQVYKRVAEQKKERKKERKKKNERNTAALNRGDQID